MSRWSISLTVLIAALIVGVSSPATNHLRPPSSSVVAENAANAPGPEHEIILDLGHIAVAHDAHPWLIRSRIVDIDKAALHRAAVDASDEPRLSVALFDDLTVPIVIHRSDMRSDKRFTISGVVPRAAGSQVVISLRNDSVYGIISIPQIGAFEIRPDGDNRHSIRHVDMGAMPECGVGPELHIEIPDMPEHRAPYGDEAATAGQYIVDVLVVYTPFAAFVTGGDDAILAMIDSAVELTNVSLLNSETDVQIELVLAKSVNYLESWGLEDPSMLADLQRLQSPTSGFMDEVHEWRANFCADLVALLVYYDPKAFQPCGMAYVMQSPGPDFADWAFSVTNVDCMPGYVFPHELGHNMGCAHAHGDPGNPGSYPFSHGHSFFTDGPTLSKQWRTIMAYPPGTTIPNFSNPDVLHLDVPTGVLAGLPEQADNALTIDTNAPVVSSFGNQYCGETFFVPDDYPTIQDAINAADSGDEIIVEPGTYVETIDFHGKAIHLRSAKGPEVTIIDGGGTGSVITCHNEEGPSTVINGFTITGGSAMTGGGLSNIDSSPTIANCIFVGNTAAWGGAMHNIGSNPTLVHCVFDDNTAPFHGGAVYNDNSSPSFVNATFLNNTATLGGGMYNRFSSPSMSSSTFQGNTADKGGAIYNHESSPSVIISTIENNTANTSGGGVFSDAKSMPGFGSTVICDNIPNNIVGPWDDLNGNTICAAPIHVPGDVNSIQEAINLATPGNTIVVAPGTYTETINLLGKPIHLRSLKGPDVTIINGGGLSTVVTCDSGEGVNTIIEGFTITGGSALRGGGMRVINSSPKVVNCIFEENSASINGGGMYNENSNTIVTNSEFRSNTAGWGAGMYNQSSNPTLTNCLFVSNAASNNAGGMKNTLGSNPTVTSCTFLANSAGSIGGAMSNAGSSSPGITNCHFEANTANQGGGLSNSDNSPPVIGNTMFCENDPDHLVGPFIDLGGNEFADSCSEACSLADLNCDGVVNVQDLLILIGSWGQCGNCADCPADLNDDCVVNVNDLLILINNWG